MVSRARRTGWIARVGDYLKYLEGPRLLLLGYASYVVGGWLLLCLPFSRVDRAGTFLDHLFTSASAVSTTGLVTLSVSDSYTWFGEGVILLLIQIGGLGYMTISSFALASVTGELSRFRSVVSENVFNLPQGFHAARFVVHSVVFTLAIEAAGAAALYPVFIQHGAPQPVWQAIFHSVSAFCTAGFGLFNNSFESYRDDVLLNVVVLVLSYLGAVGFIVLDDVFLRVTRRKAKVTLTTSIILWSTAVIAIVGTVLVAIDDTSIQGLSIGQRWLAALFQVGSASTTVGFNTVPIGAMSVSSVFLLTLVMMIGASPAGTGGGLKTTTCSAMWAVLVSVVRRRERTTFFRSEIPATRLRIAVANSVFYALVLAAGIYVVSVTETAPLPDLMFECASALGTVGLSRGITAALSDSGKWVIIALMFVGRVGPVALATALIAPRRIRRGVVPHSEDVAV